LSTSYGTPAYKVDKNMFVRLKEDGKTIVVLTTERDKWMKEKPATFFITEHYENGPYMLIDLTTVRKKDLQKLLFESWLLKAPKHLIKNK
ncbi:MAG: MmcQ/YjbR family DNA-binding protein, partial [Bacteroidota bacterium]|nr:MmcQ/YjbR family DNA-binding protein [Bacteroidota bacterium]